MSTKKSQQNVPLISHCYPTLDRVGIDFNLGREIVKQKITHISSIWCQWTDGERGCCEVWKHESEHGISVREALELAAKDGWIVVCGRPVCGCHTDDPDNSGDLSSMQEHFSK